VLISVAFGYWWFAGSGTRSPRTFDGSSSDLKRTVIVPTLDTPIPEGKSAIWCATVQLGWNQLRAKVANEPLLIRGAEELSQRLNDAADVTAALPPGSFYAAAGLTNDGIVEKIHRDMAMQFPGSPVPNFGFAAQGPAVAFSYLETGVRYTHPYRDHELDFRGGTEPAQS